MPVLSWFVRFVSVVLGTSAFLTPLALAGVPTPTGTPAPPPPGLFRVLGHVATAPDCSGDRAGITVRIGSPPSTAVTSAAGEFVFEDLPYGYYFLTFEPNCPVIPCYPPQLVFIDGSGDVTVDECYEACPASPTLSPQVGLPGTVVDVAGRCDAAANGPVGILFDDRPLAETTADTAGAYAASITVPLDAGVEEHRIRAVAGGDEVAAGTFAVTVGGAACVGDCDHNYVVTVDEVIRGTRIALQFDELNRCFAMDDSRNGKVTIEELVAAVQRALAGCPVADLVPVSAQFSRCVQRECSAVEMPTHFMEVCIANQGDADAGAFSVAQTEAPQSSARIEGLPAGGQRCVELPFASAVSVYADPGAEVDERDERNNLLELALPFPTACDIAPPPCTPTPTPPSTPTPTAT